MDQYTMVVADKVLLREELKLSKAIEEVQKKMIATLEGKLAAAI